MKHIFSAILLLFSSYNTNNSQSLRANEKIQDDIPTVHLDQDYVPTVDFNQDDVLPVDLDQLPHFSWINATLIHVKFPNGEEDNLRLLAADKVGDILVDCLFNGHFEREMWGSAVVSGCREDSQVQFTIYSVNLPNKTSFIWRDSRVTEQIENPYTIAVNETDTNDADYDFEDDEIKDISATRFRRGTFTYYDGEEEYYDVPFDGSPPPIAPDLILKAKLGFDESLLQQMSGNYTAAQAYCITVATHGSLHMRHFSLGTRIHLQFVGAPELLRGKTLRVDRESLKQVQAAKKNETIPLIVFVKTDDSNTERGVAWPGFKGGACNQTKGAAVVKWRSLVVKAAMSYAHENGHLTGLFHDFQEDRRLLSNVTCEGSGIMSSGGPGAARPARWSECSAIRIRKWHPKHGHCLVPAPPCNQGVNWVTPCTCGSGDASMACLSQHAYCWNKHAGDSPYQCLTRSDIGKGLLQKSCGEMNQVDEDISARLLVLERVILKQSQIIFDEETHRQNMEKDIADLKISMANQEKINSNFNNQVNNEKEDLVSNIVHSDDANLDKSSMEDRIKLLEESSIILDEATKINVLRTCGELEQRGVKYSGFYHLDPDGQNIGQPPIQAYCDFENHVTEILHDMDEATINIPQCDSSFCFTKEFTYAAPIEQITALIQLTTYCDQSFEFNCYSAPLSHLNVQVGVWTDRHGEDQTYFDGEIHGDHRCSCDSANNCTGSEVLQNKCNCDNNAVPNWMQDSGKITNVTALPVMKFKYGPLQYETQKANFRVGRLRCGGRREIGTTPHTCQDLKLLGETRPGLYHLQDAQHEDYPKLSFCQLDQHGYEEIMDSQSHWLKYSSGPGQVFFSVKHNGDNDISDGAVITFDETIVNEGGGMHPSTGIFTAPISGVYDFKLSGSSLSSAGTLSVQIFVNDAKKLNMYDSNTASAWNSVSRALVFRLNKGDQVKLIKASGRLDGGSYGFIFSGIIL